jgi:hypothetical protein
MKISVHRLAERELNVAMEFYSVSEPGVERDLIYSINDAINDIRQFPLASQIEIDDIRRKVVKIFPFSIYYRVINSTIRVVAIAHHSREPYYWIDRD